MTLNSVRIRWAKKLLRAKYFVVLTDKESVIAIDGADPDSFIDLLALTSQQAEMEMFYTKLGSLIKDHKRASDKLTGVKNVKKSRRSTANNTGTVADRVRRNSTKKAKS